LYLYDIKIQTDINQNGVEKSVGKSQFSKKCVCIYIYIYITKKNEHELGWAGPVLAQQQGWTQPSRVGWADVPAHSNHDWLLWMAI